MTRVNSEGRRSQEPRKKGLTKTGGERRIAHVAVLPVGVAGQVKLIKESGSILFVPVLYLPYSFISLEEKGRQRVIEARF